MRVRDHDDVAQVAGEHRISVDGDLDPAVTGRLAAILDDAVHGTGRIVVVDLSAAGFVSCRAAGLLLDCHEALRASGRQLALRGAHPALRRSLSICGLAAILDR